MYKTNGNNNFGKGLFLGFIIAFVLFGIIFLFSRCGKNDEDSDFKNENKNEETIRPNENPVENIKPFGVNSNVNTNTNINESSNVNVNELSKEENTLGKEYKDVFNGQEFTFNYASDWKIDESEKNKVGLVDSSDSSSNNKGNIVFTFKSNKQSLDFDRFYDGLNDVNYFSDSASGFEKMRVNNLDAYKFKNVSGYSNSTIVVVKTANGYVEISDLENKYQNNGTFEDVVQSFTVK